MRQVAAGVAAWAAWRVLVAAVYMLVIASCGGSSKEAARPQAEPAPAKEAAPPPEPASAAGAPAIAPTGEPGDLPAPPDVAAPPKDAKTSPKGVFYKVLAPGKGGPKPTAEDTVRVHYTGWTTDGKMFDSSVVRGEPNDFPLKHLIPGWTDAIPVMSVGDKVRFWIPEELAYKGKPGMPPGMLVFDVQLIAIVPPGS
ncbi:MAG TPA: FKBP-type peptidyl-prolyl cis-trans isomerase [Kofleriaceae bacterium]|nr:FKBP-type peptidyl-prolyl cis-trans isomerase [Kofleriaceae bacterium]